MNRNGLVFYRGPSQIDGKPIVGILSGLLSGSDNIKTGNLIQSYILVDNDKFPHENASYGNADVSVCGDCIHRGSKEQKSGSCYVNLGQGPYNVFKQYKEGKYKEFEKSDRILLSGKYIRMGAYGDPSAIPYEVWEELTWSADDHTGYTHQWRVCDQRFRYMCMASIDNDSEYDFAKLLGWRTFRVKNKDEQQLKYEIVCPASPDLEKKRTCQTCMACNGARDIVGGDKRRDIVINVHGLVWKKDVFSKKVSLL